MRRTVRGRVRRGLAWGQRSRPLEPEAEVGDVAGASGGQANDPAALWGPCCHTGHMGQSQAGGHPRGRLCPALGPGVPLGRHVPRAMCHVLPGGHGAAAGPPQPRFAGRDSEAKALCWAQGRGEQGRWPDPEARLRPSLALVPQPRASLGVISLPHQLLAAAGSGDTAPTTPRGPQRLEVGLHGTSQLPGPGCSSPVPRVPLRGPGVAGGRGVSGRLLAPVKSSSIRPAARLRDTDSLVASPTGWCLRRGA